jgi:hypothetical protein
MTSVAKKCKAIGKFTHKSTEANKALVREARREGMNKVQEGSQSSKYKMEWLS